MTRGQRLELDYDRRRGGLRLREGLRGDRRDRLAVVSYEVRRRTADGRRCRCRGARARRPPVTIARTPGIFRACRNVDANDPGGGHLGAQQRRVEHSGRRPIDRVARAAAQLVACVASREIHDRAVGSTWFVAPSRRRCERKRRVDDALVAGAAAEISDQRRLYVVSRWDARRVRRKLVRVISMPGKAHSALHRVVLLHAPLQRREIAVRRQRFDREHRASRGEPGRHQARHDRAAVEQHRAGAAETFAADDLGAGQKELVSQERRRAGSVDRWPIPDLRR